jgi:hypothetical protein
VWNLRFLRPAVPTLLVLASAGVVPSACRGAGQHALALFLALATLCGYGLHTARKIGAFDTQHLRRYEIAGDYIAHRLPERAVLLSMLHSGSATYYSGRPTLRYDLLPASDLDRLVSELEQRGYVPYLVIDSDERTIFQERYRGHSRLASLDWKPIVSLHTPPVEIFAVGAEEMQRR